MTVSFLNRFVGLLVPVQKIFVLPWLLQQALYKNYFTSLIPIAQQAGQDVVLRCLSLNMYWLNKSSNSFSFQSASKVSSTNKPNMPTSCKTRKLITMTRHQSLVSLTSPRPYINPCLVYTETFVALNAYSVYDNNKKYV